MARRKWRDLSHGTCIVREGRKRSEELDDRDGLADALAGTLARNQKVSSNTCSADAEWLTRQNSGLVRPRPVTLSRLHYLNSWMTTTLLWVNAIRGLLSSSSVKPIYQRSTTLYINPRSPHFQRPPERLTWRVRKLKFRFVSCHVTCLYLGKCFMT